MLGLVSILAHAGPVDDPAGLWNRWNTEPTVTAMILLVSGLYLQGIVRLWARAGVGRVVRHWEVLCFAGGALSLAAALVSPIHPLGQVLFFAHMTQHEILMLISAPLLVLGRPMVAMLWALPRTWASTVGRLINGRALHALRRLLGNAYVAWVVHLVALWIWHIPALFDATIERSFIHALQHASFLGSALLFWSAIIQVRRTAPAYGLAILYLFSTAMQTGLLGVLITFASQPMYAPYVQTAQAYGFTPLEDQQLGGLIMWIPGGLVYLVACLLFFAGWMSRRQPALADWSPPIPAGSR